MATYRYTKTLLATVGPSVAKQVVAQKAQYQQVRSLYKQVRSITLASAARQQAALKQDVSPDPRIADFQTDKDRIKAVFRDGTETVLPHVWLRDNCQCSSCFDNVALGRKLLLQDLNVETFPSNITASDDGNLHITWDDGHESQYSCEWLYKRAFTPKARHNFRNQHRISKIPWSSDFKMTSFNYEDLVNHDESLLKWLITLEKYGAALVKNCPPGKDDAGCDLIKRVAFVKQSHYGEHSPVINRPSANNVAFSNAKLGLHNDLVQYDHIAGIIMILTVKQHEGTGGESVVSDGLYAAEVLRQHHPGAFDLLTKTGVYFWDKGFSNLLDEQDFFYKITKWPIIQLNVDGTIERISVNQPGRDSHLDVAPDQVKSLYKAMHLYNRTLYENSINFKMETGDMMTLDNTRCQHGREGYTASSDRHLESSYLDWDEARCRRRRLHEKYPEVKLY